MTSKLEQYTPLIKIAMDRAKQNDVYAIVRMQDVDTLGLQILNGDTLSKVASSNKGIGISVFTKDGASGFAETSRLDNKSVTDAIDLAANIAKSSSQYKDVEHNTEIFGVKPLKEKLMQKTKYTIQSKSSHDVEEIVRGINNWTRSLDDRLTVTTAHNLVEEEWRIARSDGTDVTFNMPRSIIFSSLTLKENDKISEAHFKVQGQDMGLILGDMELYNKKAKNTTNLVAQLLNAGTMKGGHYKALLSHPFVGLNAHEAVGHAFETDSLKNSIVGINGKLRKGEKATPSNISFIDGPVEGLYGSQFISSNGIPRKTVEFIKNGVIVDALSDVFSAKDAGVEIKGCSRAESYADQPICRMSATRAVDHDPYPYHKSFEDTTMDDLYNLLIKHDELKPGEIIVYPVISVGGQVNSAQGTYVFNCAGIYTIENPKKIILYKPSLFSGDTLATIATRTKGIGDVVIDNPGMCGRGQSAAVSNGGNMYIIIDKTKHIIFGGKQ